MIVVDIETTGLDERKCGIVSIGAVDFKNPKNQFYVESRVSSNCLIEDKALEINGFTRDQLFDSSKMSESESLMQFSNWASNGIADMALAGENIGFDTGFLEYNFGVNKIPWIFGHRSLDLHTTSRDVHDRICVQTPLKNKLSSLSLDETLKFVGLPTEPKPHNGLTGAKMEAEAFSRLKYAANLLEEYSKYKIPGYLKR